MFMGYIDEFVDAMLAQSNPEGTLIEKLETV